MSLPDKIFAKDLKTLRIAIAAGLTVWALVIIVGDYVKNLENENCIITCPALLQSGILLLLA